VSHIAVRSRHGIVLLSVLVVCALLAPVGVWAAVVANTTLLLDPASPGPSGWYTEPPLVSLVAGQSGTLHWWWDADAEQTALVVAGGTFFVGAAPEGEHIIHGYTVGGFTESPGVNWALKVDSGAPTQPSTFEAVVEHNVGVDLSWGASSDGVSGVDHYAVYRRAGTPPFQPTDVIWTGSALSYVDVPPAEGDYAYAVSAFDVAGNESALSDVAVGYRDFAAPIAPEGVTAAQIGWTSGIRVSWSHTGTDTATYQIERSRSGGAFALAQTVPAGTNSWSDPLAGFSPAEQFTSVWAYRVRALGPGGISAYGTSASMRLSTAPTSMTISSSTSRPRTRRHFTLSGVLAGGDAGSRCTVYVRRPWSRRWTKLTTRTAYAGAAGGPEWSYRHRRFLRGYYLFQVRFTGDVAHAGSTSPTIRVKVR
jgi:hypothetical protein